MRPLEKPALGPEGAAMVRDLLGRLPREAQLDALEALATRLGFLLVRRPNLAEAAASAKRNQEKREERRAQRTERKA